MSSRISHTGGAPSPDVPSPYAPLTIAETARRVAAGEDFWHAVKELLDDVAHVARSRHGGDDGRLAALLAERPPHLDPRRDAFLGGLAEHLALVHDVDRPAWAVEPDRFLPVAWFPSRYRAFDALAVRESPAAFRRRGVYLEASFLDRC